MTTVPRKRPKNIAKIAADFAEFRRLKNAELLAKKGHERLRDEVLLPALIAQGVPHGDKGQHLAIKLPEPVDGFTTIVRRTNSSPFIDIDAAEAFAKRKGFLEEIQSGHVTFHFTGTPAEAKRVTALLRKAGLTEYADADVDVRFDQDRLMAYHQKHREDPPKTSLTESELDALFDETVTYSLHPEKD